MPPEPMRWPAPPRLAFAPLRVPASWQGALVRLGLAWAVLIALFWPDWRAMAGQWWNSSTYTHVLVVPAILVWLVWLRAGQLARLEPRCWAPGLPGLGAALLLWALGAFAGFAEASEAGAVLMLIAAVPLLLGVRVAAGLVFPLGYALFLVPVGDELVAPLQTVTAWLTIALIHLSHVRATIDGVFINTPAGLFEIAEACSGVKFLIAMIAFGALAANVCFVSWRRRAGLMLACVVVPILANGVRAWGTVYVAQVKGAAYAGGFDHIVYGWIFFGIVIAGTIAVAWRYFDRAADDAMIDGAALAASPRLARLERLSLVPAAALAMAGALALGAQLWVSAAEQLAAPMPAHIDLPEVAGWRRVPYLPRQPWVPRASGADHRLLGRYADGQGHVVDVFFALYASQGQGKKAGGFGEGALRPHSGWDWQGVGPSVADAVTDRMLTGGPTERLAETSYRTGSLLTGSNLALKLANIRDRLLLRARPTMLLILSAERVPGQPPAPADAIAAFRHAAGPLGPWMDHIARLG